MNTLDIIIIVIIGISALTGLVRGFIRTLFGLTSLVIALVLTWMVTPAISQAIIDNTAFDEMISEKVVELLNVEEAMGVTPDSLAEATMWIGELPLPGSTLQKLTDSYTPEIVSMMKAGGIGDFIGTFLSRASVRALVFIVAFFIITILLNTLVNILDLIARLPVIKQANRLGGFGIGLLIGITCVWIGALGLSFALSIHSTDTFSALIETSILGRLFYYNNPLQDFIMNIEFFS